MTLPIAINHHAMGVMATMTASAPSELVTIQTIADAHIVQIAKMETAENKVLNL
jgi:hypothetical protein